MNKTEKRLTVAALVFVGIYIGAVVLTFHSRVSKPSGELRIEANRVDEATRHIMLVEVLPPMLVLFTLAVCFVVVRKKQLRARQRLDEYETEHPPEMEYQLSGDRPSDKESDNNTSS